MKTLEKPQAA